MGETFKDIIGPVDVANQEAKWAQWMNLLRSRHVESYQHCVRVATLGRMMAQACRFSPDESASFVQGCFFHDLGKLKIPLEILNSPHPLTAPQWEEMKRHSQYGFELLQQEGMGELELAVVLHHHERWDGRGYPHGLGGDSIPYFARICAVIDAFDSMMSTRPYRPRRTIGDAMEELRRHAGKQFDAQLVERFIGLTESISRMYESDLDSEKTIASASDDFGAKKGRVIMQSTGRDQYVEFSAGSENYAIPISDIHEIIRLQNITEIPNNHRHVKGVINLRGKIVPVISLRALFSLHEEVEAGKAARIIVVHHQEESVGIIVDRVNKVIQFSDVQEPPERVGGISGAYFVGIGVTSTDLVGILKLDEVLLQ